VIRIVNKLIEELSNRRFIIVSGKGGVGKTTFSAALGIKLAEIGMKVLVVSLDPAHSLGDAYGIKIGSSVKKLDKNLYALEFNPIQLFAAEKEALIKAIREESSEAPMGIPIDEEAIELLLDAQLPYEFAEGLGFIKLFYHLMTVADYDSIIFDTAPTGHTVELLKLPEILESFYVRLIKFRLRISKVFSKIKKLFGFGYDDRADMALRLLEETKEQITNVRKVLTDESKTEFVVVMIPNEMSILESARLIEQLAIHEIPNNNIIVNFVRIYGGDCPFCVLMSKYHNKQLGKIRKEFSDKKLWVIPYFSEEIRGIKVLKKVSEVIGELDIEKALRMISEGTTIE